MSCTLSKQLRRATRLVASNACHHIGTAQDISAQLNAHSSQIYCPSPAAVALVDSLSDSHLADLAVTFEAFSVRMAASGCSNYYDTIQDFLENVPALLLSQRHKQQQWASSAGNAAATRDPWPMSVTVHPVTAGHRSYSSVAAALQLRQQDCVAAARTFYPGDPIGPYYSIVMPSELHDMAFGGAAQHVHCSCANQPEAVCAVLGSQRIMFDASCCREGDHNKLAKLLDYRCSTSSGSDAREENSRVGPNAVFLVYVDSVGWPWLFVVALRMIAAGEEICVDYGANFAKPAPEALFEKIKYQRAAKLQLREQLQPIMQRLRAAMQDMQSAVEAAAEQQQQQQNLEQVCSTKQCQQNLERRQHCRITAAYACSSNSCGKVDSWLQHEEPVTGTAKQWQLMQSRNVQLKQPQHTTSSTQLISSLLDLSFQVLQLEQLVEQPTEVQGSTLQTAIVPQSHDDDAQLPQADAADATSAGVAAAIQTDDEAAENAKELVLKMLDSSIPEVQLQAVAALDGVLKDAKNRQCLVAAGAVPCIVRLLCASSAACTCTAGSTIGDRVGGTASCTTGGTPGHAVSSTATQAAVQAAAAAILRNLAAGSVTLKHAVLAAGGVSSLVHILSSTNEACQLNAALALRDLASSAAHRQAVATAQGAIQGLLGLLSSSNTAVQEAAAAAVKNLTEGDVGRNAVEASADGVLLLIQLLVSSGNEPVQQAAAAALSNLAAGSPLSQKLIAAAPGSISALVRMLTSFNEASQTAAAAALSSLAAGPADIKVAIQGTPGAVPGLIWLLGGDSPKLQTLSAVTLGGLCAGSLANKQSVAAFPGAIPGLVSLLFTARTTTQVAVAATLSNLAAAAGIKDVIGQTPGAIGGVVQLLMTNQKRVQHAAAAALSNLAAGSTHNRQVILDMPGVTSRLTQLLRSNDEAVQMAAATALANLAREIIHRHEDREVQLVAAELQAVQKSSSSSRVQLAACAACKRLSRGLPRLTTGCAFNAGHDIYP